MYRKEYYDVDWEFLSNFDSVEEPKFAVGDKVAIINSDIDNTGIVSEVFSKNMFGQFEYYVEIRDNGRYCYENEIEMFKGEF